MAGAIDIVLPGESPGAPPVSVKKLVAGQYFGELALFDDKAAVGHGHRPHGHARDGAHA
jgi:hypothetical protein